MAKEESKQKRYIKKGEKNAVAYPENEDVEAALKASGWVQDGYEDKPERVPPEKPVEQVV